jgi:midasin
MTPGIIQTLRQIALHLSLRFPILLTSEPSSGKSLLLSYLAGVLHPAVENQIITIHLADTSLDPRSLLGSYVSSPSKPGNFEWKEGVLIRAMKQGKWVVLKDIDRGSAEVLGVLKPLVESLGAAQCIGKCANMEVPGQGQVEGSEHFAIFATRSVVSASSGDYLKPIFFGAHKFHEVINPSPSRDELRLIIGSKFPCLTGNPARAVIGLWESVCTVGARTSSSRIVGMRELDKFCARLAKLLPQPGPHMDVYFEEHQVPKLSSIVSNPTLREEIYLEARDIFFGSGILTAAARHHTERVASVVGDHLGLAWDRQSWLLYGHTPELRIEKDVNGRNVTLLIGRNRMPATQIKERVVPESPTFAMHKPAISLLSRLSSAITLGEPVLLTGETGTGKTSLITHLASILRKPLVSLNLSNQTESSDLLGGFKPIDPRVPGSELQMRFTQLFGETFSRRKNAKFEESVRKAVLDHKWKRAVALWKEAVRLAKDKIRERNDEDEPASVTILV